jgi:hypothetical protein
LTFYFIDGVFIMGTIDYENDAQEFAANLEKLIDALVFAGQNLTDHEHIQIKQRLESALSIFRAAQA